MPEPNHEPSEAGRALHTWAPMHPFQCSVLAEPVHPRFSFVGAPRVGYAPTVPGTSRTGTRPILLIALLAAAAPFAASCSSERESDENSGTDAGAAPDGRADATAGPDAAGDTGAPDADPVDSGAADGAPGNDSGARDTGGSSPASFTDVYAIIETECRPCHFDRPLFGDNLDMVDADTAYANLVDRPASCGSGNIRVIPGNAADSLLYRKITATNLCGARMPFGRPPLASSLISVFESWIASGAPRN